MLNLIGDFLWIASFAVEVYVVARALFHKDFLRYLSLNLFVSAMALKEVADFVVFRQYGLASSQYAYCYYYGDLMLTILMYLTITHLYYQVFQEMGLHKYVRGAALGLLGATSLFAFIVVQESTGHLTVRFVIELSQDLYFVGLVLTYLLWGAVFKLRETRSRLVQLVLALGIYFSGTAALYAMRNMFPDLHVLYLFLVPILGFFLPAAWAYTFSHVPEESRLAPQRLAEGLVTHR